METINSKKSKVVTRSYSSDEEVIASSFPRSSFSNSYHNAFDGIIGRIIPAAVFDVLPKSQFEGVNAGAITMERMITPTMPDTSMHSYNFYCSYRAVDRDYQETAAPSKINNFSANMHFPMFKANELFYALFRYITENYQVALDEVATYALTSWIKIYTHAYTNEASAKTLFEAVAGTGTQPAMLDNTLPSSCVRYWKNVYLAPLAADFDQYFLSFNIGTTQPYTDACDRLRYTLDRFLQYAMGEGSLMDFLGYFIADTSKLRECKAASDASFLSWIKNSFYSSSLVVGSVPVADVLPLNEYALRIYAAVWVEYFRQPLLQPLNNHLRYQRWDSVSILGQPADSYIHFRAKPEEAMLLLFMRAAPFGEDRVSTAHVDDVCRNVYAPIISTAQSNKFGAVDTTNLGINSAGPQALNDLHSGLSLIDITYRDVNSNSNVAVKCPVPSMVGNFLNNTDGPQTNKSAIMLDLQTLRTSEKLQRELKRRMWFGDSYFDVVRADYDCDISDADVLRPHILGDGATTIVGASQEIANTTGSAVGSERGTRTAVAGGNMPNDPYTGFAQESGIVLNLVYMSMRVSYNPLRDFNAVRSYVDMIRPIFAGTNESVMHKYSVNRHAVNAPAGYGFEPYGNYYRTHVDTAHGKFLKEYKDYIALRDPEDVKLNGDFLTMVQLPLGHFADTIMLDGQYYVMGTHEFNVTHSLPAPVEVI